MSKQDKAPKTPKPVKVDSAELDRLVDGAHYSPHSILGPHVGKNAVTLRVLRHHRKPDHLGPR